MGQNAKRKDMSILGVKKTVTDESMAEALRSDSVLQEQDQSRSEIENESHLDGARRHTQQGAHFSEYEESDSSAKGDPAKDDPAKGDPASTISDLYNEALKTLHLSTCSIPELKKNDDTSTTMPLEEAILRDLQSNSNQNPTEVIQKLQAKIKFYSKFTELNSIYRKAQQQYATTITALDESDKSFVNKDLEKNRLKEIWEEVDYAIKKADFEKVILKLQIQQQYYQAAKVLAKSSVDETNLASEIGNLRELQDTSIPDVSVLKENLKKLENKYKEYSSDYEKLKQKFAKLNSEVLGEIKLLFPDRKEGINLEIKEELTGLELQKQIQELEAKLVYLQDYKKTRSDIEELYQNIKNNLSLLGKDQEMFRSKAQKIYEKVFAKGESGQELSLEVLQGIMTELKNYLEVIIEPAKEFKFSEFLKNIHSKWQYQTDTALQSLTQNLSREGNFNKKAFTFFQELLKLEPTSEHKIILANLKVISAKNPPYKTISKISKMKAPTSKNLAILWREMLREYYINAIITIVSTDNVSEELKGKVIQFIGTFKITAGTEELIQALPKIFELVYKNLSSNNAEQLIQSLNECITPDLYMQMECATYYHELVTVVCPSETKKEANIYVFDNVIQEVRRKLDKEILDTRKERTSVGEGDQQSAQAVLTGVTPVQFTASQKNYLATLLNFGVKPVRYYALRTFTPENQPYAERLEQRFQEEAKTENASPALKVFVAFWNMHIAFCMMANLIEFHEKNRDARSVADVDLNNFIEQIELPLKKVNDLLSQVSKDKNSEWEPYVNSIEIAQKKLETVLARIKSPNVVASVTSVQPGLEIKNVPEATTNSSPTKQPIVVATTEEIKQAKQKTLAEADSKRNNGSMFSMTQQLQASANNADQKAMEEFARVAATEVLNKVADTNYLGNLWLCIEAIAEKTGLEEEPIFSNTFYNRILYVYHQAIENFRNRLTTKGKPLDLDFVNHLQQAESLLIKKIQTQLKTASPEKKFKPLFDFLKETQRVKSDMVLAVSAVKNVGSDILRHRYWDPIPVQECLVEISRRADNNSNNTKEAKNSSSVASEGHTIIPSARTKRETYLLNLMKHAKAKKELATNKRWDEWEEKEEKQYVEKTIQKKYPTGLSWLRRFGIFIGILSDPATEATREFYQTKIGSHLKKPGEIKRMEQEIPGVTLNDNDSVITTTQQLDHIDSALLAKMISDNPKLVDNFANTESLLQKLLAKFTLQQRIQLYIELNKNSNSTALALWQNNTQYLQASLSLNGATATDLAALMLSEQKHDLKPISCFIVNNYICCSKVVEELIHEDPKMLNAIFAPPPPEAGYKKLLEASALQKVFLSLNFEMDEQRKICFAGTKTRVSSGIMRCIAYSVSKANPDQSLNSKYAQFESTELGAAIKTAKEAESQVALSPNSSYAPVRTDEQPHASKIPGQLTQESPIKGVSSDGSQLKPPQLVS